MEGFYQNLANRCRAYLRVFAEKRKSAVLFTIKYAFKEVSRCLNKDSYLLWWSYL